MGKYQRKSGVTQGQTSGTKAPLMKYGEAAHMADKNSKTMVKISQLLEVVNDPNYENADPDRYVEKYVAKLKKRVNQRLKKLAKWADSSPDERQSEFRVFRGSYTSSRSSAVTRTPSQPLVSRPNPTPITYNPNATIGIIPSQPQQQPQLAASFPLLASALAERSQQKSVQSSTSVNEEKGEDKAAEIKDLLKESVSENKSESVPMEESVEEAPVPVSMQQSLSESVSSVKINESEEKSN